MVDPRHSAHKPWYKTAIVTSQMTESKQEESCSRDQHGDAAPRCIRELHVLTAAEQTNSDENWIIVCAERDRAFVQTGVKHLQFKPEDGTLHVSGLHLLQKRNVMAALLSQLRHGGGREGGEEKKSYGARSSPRPCENVTLAPGPGC